jgi:RHS repeat-associated protein
LASTGNDQHRSFVASGPGSRLELPALTSITNGTHFNSEIHITAENGGFIDLSHVTQLVDPNSGSVEERAINVTASGPSTIDLSALTHFTDLYGFVESGWGQYSRMVAQSTGRIRIGQLAETSLFRSVLAAQSGGGRIHFSGGSENGPQQGLGSQISIVAENRWDFDTLITEGTIATVGSSSWDFNGSLVLNESGRLDLSATSSMNLTGSLTGTTTHSGSRVLGTITLDGSGTVGNPQRIEVMGRDLGNDPFAFTNNFVIHQLTLANSTYVQLIDEVDNSSGSETEALYVNSLVVPLGTTLDLNGLTLYTRGSAIQGQIQNGEVVQLADTGPIPVNVPTSGGIGVPGELDEWTFFGRAGREMTIWVNPGNTSTPSSVAPFVGFVEVTLRNSVGSVLASGFSSTNGQVVMLSSIPIPADGVYTVHVRAATAQSTNTGNYLAAVWDATPDVNAMQVNQHYVGQIETPFSVDRWTFMAQANQQVRFDLLNRTNTSIVFDFTGPNGWTGITNRGSDSDPITLPHTGAYTLTAKGSGGQYGGHYTFTMDQTPQTDLILGDIFTGSIVGSAHAQLFRVIVPDSAPMLVRLDDLSGLPNHNELYAKLGAAPTRSNFDARFCNPAAPDQSLVIPRAAPGEWFILVYGGDVPSASTFTLRAVTSSVLLDSITPDRHGRFVNTVLTLTGAGFVPGSTVALIGSGGVEYPATSTEIDSTTQITVIYAANSLPVGVYDVRVRHPDTTTSVLAGALTMTEGTAAELRTNLVLPGSMRFRGTSEIIVEYENVGDVAMPAPLLRLEATFRGATGARMTLDAALVTQGFWTSAQPEGFDPSVQFLAQGATPGILQPGETARTTVYYAGWDFVGIGRDPFHFQLYITDTANTTPIDWNAIKESMRPPTIVPAAWDVIYANLIAQTGATWGDYVRMLGENALSLGRLGRTINDVGDLLAFEVQQAIGLSPVSSLATATDAVVLAPGLDITFNRTYLTSISQRHVVGPLGRGWVWLSRWDETSEARADGTIVIRSIDGGERVFQPDSRDSTRYFSERKDYATISNVQGRALVLEESDGTQLRFDLNGRPASITDTNGNRIDATYVLGNLTRLTHSVGQWLELEYNTAGRIAALRDAAGRETLYTYDGSNEHLLSVRNFDGRVTNYTYIQGQGPAREHAIAGVEPPTGVITYFTYDAQGRFATVSKANGVELTSFGYDAAGTVSLTTPASESGPGGTRRLFYDHDVRLAREQNELGHSTYRQYDALGNLLRLTDAEGRSTVYEYGRDGLTTAVTDALGNSTLFAYDGPFDRMTSFTDANDNTTVYAYDTRGNLLSITDPAGRAERWTYDARGNVATSTNRRNQTILYGYNIDGQLTSKTGGVSEAFNYDARGNLISTVDPTGTTTYEYEAGTDRLHKMTYPGGKFLQYEYCTCGRRESITDELDYMLGYNYDVAGNLTSLVDNNGVTLVEYTFDDAGLMSRKELANGVYTTYSYDAVGQVLTLVNRAPDDSVLSRFEYTYDARGLRTSMETIEGRWEYDYDEIGQLVGWTDPNLSRTDFEYDRLGNRLTETIDGAVTSYTVNNLNQYTQVGSKTYLYDLDGNLTRETDGSTLTNYAFNVENRLTSVTRGSQSWSYTYDALGNRVTATELGVTTRFVVDPIGYGNVVGEYQSSNLVARNVSGYGLVSRAEGGQASYYTFEAIGSTSEMTNAAGAVQAHYTYTPFGVPVVAQASPSNPYRFIGMYGIRRESNGLDWMRARSLLAISGRFLSHDPLQLGGGSVNYYPYVENQPTVLIDPLVYKVRMANVCVF